MASGNFTLNVLILIYAIVILGGIGSIAGPILGAIVINVSLQFLQPQNDHPDIKRWLFYGAIVLFIALTQAVVPGRRRSRRDGWRSASRSTRSSRRLPPPRGRPALRVRRGIWLGGEGHP